MLRRALFASKFLALVWLLGSSATVHAGLITNGDFSQYTAGAPVPNNHYLAHIGNVNPPNGSLEGKGTLTGWTVYQGTSSANSVGVYAYLYNTANQTGLVSPAATPPNGSNFLGILGDNSGGHYSVNSVQQTINGLTAGQFYSVSFDWAASAPSGYTPNNIGWDVSLGGGTAQEVTVTNNSSGHTTPWMHTTFLFQAHTTSEVLEFLAVNKAHSGPPMALLTNIDMELHPVPEPSTLVSLELGVIGFVTVGLRRRACALKTA